MIRRLLDRLRARDPGSDGVRRALRAAIVIPAVALAGFLIGGSTEAPSFAVVGAISLTIAANFPGNRATRAAAYTVLAVIGVALITLGSLVAPHPLLALLSCLAVGVLVSVPGMISDVIAAGQRAALMTFILAVCTQPVGPIGDRILGWLIAVAICVPAAIFLFPPRYNSDLRLLAARVCAALADRIEGGSSPEKITEAMTALRREFLSSAFRPVAMSSGSRALIRVVSNLQWLCDRVDEDTRGLLGHIDDMGIAVLRSSADVLRTPDSGNAAELARIVATHRLIAISHYDNDIQDILAQPDDAAAVELGARLLSRRTMSATIGLTGSLIAAATIADTRPVWERLLGRSMPETGIADRVHGKRTALASLGGYLSTGSITVLNSVRTGLALALAYAVTLILPVQNGLWILLGTLSVLRSSASSTRTTAMRAITGTVIGFIVGAALIKLVGTEPLVLWSLLPIVAFGSTYVLVVGSFTASQAMFTMQVLIVFNMMRPVGWKVGLIRIEDIALGAAVGLVVSALLWPGGAAAAVRRAIDAALATGSRYLEAAVLRVTKGATPERTAEVHALSADVLTAARTHGDAIRIYLSENGGAIDADLLDTANLIPRLRTAADLVADIAPPRPGVFPRARQVLEEHTAALCLRIAGGEPGGPSLPPLSGEFVVALRAEADVPDAALVALPLVTAAANVGELELLYPQTPAALPAGNPPA